MEDGIIVAAPAILPPGAVTQHQPIMEHASDGVDGESTRRRKRKKYSGKACGPCKRRKIKCGGGSPCGPCLRRRRACHTTDLPEVDELEIENEAVSSGGPEASNQDSRALRDRLAALESHMTNLTQALLPLLSSAKAAQSIPNISPRADPLQSCSSDGYNSERQGLDDGQQSQGAATRRSPKDHLSFATAKNVNTNRNLGETSVVHAVQRIEDRLNELGVPIVEGESAPTTPPMTPVPINSRDWKIGLPRHRIFQALGANGIEPNRKQFDEYLETFKIEVYALYPFLTEQIISDTYEEFWDSLTSLHDERAADDLYLDRVVHTLLMLAIGRCTVSSRVQTGDGLHSAGWSLYCTAMDLQGSLLDAVNDDSKPLSSLHTLALVVIYLMRLDANERAQKVLSLAVVHAHHLGMHLSQTLDDMPAIDAELFKRIWWCIYVLDRRLALVLGRPFLIQDTNITIGPPKDLDISSPEATDGSALDFYHLETEPREPSPIHYLFVMVGYSKLVGKVWESLFGAGSRTEEARPRVHEYLDAMVHNWMDSIPKFLICDHEDVHNSGPIGLSSMHFKQRFLLRLRYFYVLIIIRSPTKRPQITSIWSNNIQSETLCLQHAQSIISMFAQCSIADGVYGFPFLAYLLEATITMIACLTRLPTLKARYRNSVELADRLLNQYCKKAWISGKMVRIIYKLGAIIPRVVSPNQIPIQQLGLRAQRASSHSLSVISTPTPSNNEARISKSTTSYQPWRVHQPPHNLHGADHSSPNLSPGTQASNEDSQFTALLHHGDGSESSSAALQSSMIADFPFELNFVNAGMQLQGHKEAGSTDEFGLEDLGWLDEMVGQDNRFFAFA